MIRQLRLVQFVGTVGLVCWLSAGCSGDEPPPPTTATEAAPSASASNTTTAPGESHGAAIQACVENRVRECRVELGAQGSVRNCFVGLQLCTNGKWGPCVDPDKVEAQLNGN